VQLSKSLVLLALAPAFVACKKDEPPPQGAPSAAPAPAPPGAALPPSPVALAPTGSLASFEGEVNLSIHTSSVKAPISMVVFVKGQRLRFDVPAGLDHDPQLGRSPRIVLDLGLKRMTAVADERKTAVVMSLDAIDQMQKSMGAAAPPVDPPRIAKTGRKATFAGYTCEDWELTSKNGDKATVCMSDEPAPWTALPMSGMTSSNAWAREVFDGKHLPLKITSASAQGTTDMEVTKIEKKTVAEPTFETPAGYRVMDMSELMKGMMAGAASAQAAAGGLPPSPAARAMLEQLRQRAAAAQKKPE
jgi:hypothetical protein